MVDYGWREGCPCPECKSMDIVEHTREGNVVCRGCGLVVSDRVYVDQEWRTFSNDGVTADNDRCRVGMALDISTLISGSSSSSVLGTSISSAGGRGESHRLGRMQKKVNPMSRLEKLVKDMTHILERNRVPPPTIARAMENLRLMYSSVKEAGGQLRDIPAKMAVCTYYAYNGGIRMDIPKQWFGCHKKTFNRVRKSLSETFQKQQQVNSVSEQHNKFIKNIVNSLVVKEEDKGRMHQDAGRVRMAITNTADTIRDSLKQANIGQSFDPFLFMCAVVWKAIVAVRQEGMKVDEVLEIPKSLEGMARHFGVNLATLNNHCNIILPEMITKKS